MHISKIKLHNFRRFTDLEINFKNGRNILVGDNESGKSSILQAIDLVARGSRHRVEDIGIETIFNKTAINSFMEGDKKYENLPELYVELYIENVIDEELDGRNNSDGKDAYGIRMYIYPDDTFSNDIRSVLETEDAAFPFEFYSITFKTFADVPYNGYTRKIKTIFLDNSTIGGEYALNEYITSIYGASLTTTEQLSAKYKYGTSKNGFKQNVLSKYSEKLEAGYTFSVKNTGKNCLESDLTIEKDGVAITEKGTGIQCYIKTQLALKRAKEIPVIMIEEPENHLSHVNMRRLIDDIENNSNAQMFIATHSDLISTRLNLRNCILMNSSDTTVIKLDFIDESTAAFFMKAPDNNMLQFVLSKKIILVEGDAEYILMDAFCAKILNHTLSELGIEVLSVDGKCFKRYLEIARTLGMKVAVISDNDGNYASNITAFFEGYIQDESPNIKIFSDTDNNRRTFEVAVYQDNKEACDELFEGGRKTLSVLEYMIANKAETAFQLLTNKKDTIQTPGYIKNALEWINV